VPMYHRIADQFRERILAGELAPGQRLPSEPELMDAYTVSRNTVRLALRRLTEEGLLLTDHGRGSFVRERPEPIGSILSVVSMAVGVAVDARKQVARTSPGSR
jgi:DNA-binding GntR family transcriptional regulator